MTAEEYFYKYTDSYKKYGKLIDLKINHTVRVKDLCIEIAKGLNLSKEDISLAELCGLLHDIGRFEQWKQYKTYDDLKSLDHGNLGEKILKDNNFINNFTKNNHTTILRAVKYHNKFKIPNTLSERNKLFTNITRDADKIDILNLFATKELEIKIDDNSIITNKIYKKLINKNQILRKDVKSKADQIGICIGFIFDLNYKKSYEIIKEKDLFNKMIDVQLEKINNNELIKQVQELKIFTNEYIEEMIKC